MKFLISGFIILGSLLLPLSAFGDQEGSCTVDYLEGVPQGVDCPGIGYFSLCEFIPSESSPPQEEGEIIDVVDNPLVGVPLEGQIVDPLPAAP